MIGKHNKLANPYQMLQYVVEKPGAELLKTHLLPHTNEVNTLTHQMELSWQHNHRIQRPVYHASLSLSPPERLDDKTWIAIADDYLTRMGYTSVPYIVVRHTDTDHDHIHMVAGRCSLETNRCVKDNWDHLRSRKIIKELERQYNLTPTSNVWETERNSETVSMVRHYRDTGQKAVKPKLQELIDAVCDLNKPLDLPAVADSLQQLGVQIAIAPTPTQQPGITYHYQGIHFSGSQLGRHYTLKGLRTHKGINIPTSNETLWHWWENYKNRTLPNSPSTSQEKAYTPKSRQKQITL
ncbi:relaxase/mobilization nuclease domain-containing protein [Desertifilum sp. FACHB-1129]|uniref:relaxase/mobilization nuclease domain-containing protein n=1 Tax=unclassified Desertifilum TaxID=2621682 RepID=UPI001687815D|nr:MULTISPECIES: relaxase/mobilization nuclease domain-containing protein [unclassified Desertifilum]MBD2311231.1 relaxase/mobilization nuclease domain-containing protein [Desertifilum sp. FACHB-1129]MBD2324324.1 relaxase/mobilization nuclease domain-containing protein [Desertifilum sp. FACHB-866]MBD2334338.1 relaxase/mobilization nuclease domain-containing protein [Desertifilum sp. FACHB-868]MDA0213184.1 relaxase/mobilization nuclease domain-containing protein [Cyanobacteria bacterium FC1]